MTWTAETPTHPGYYWCRRGPGYGAFIMWVSGDGTAVQMGSTDTPPAATLGMEWRGPLRPGDDEAEDWPP
jgi:hypothetical protein